MYRVYYWIFSVDPKKKKKLLCRMKIVTYNVNGLRPRVSQFGSLRKLLDSFDADIICFQETKLSRQELKADLVQAEGYESFFSCTRTTQKGRTGYSGVATFCRVKSAFSSYEVSLPVSAEEGFTGALSSDLFSRKSEYSSTLEGLEEFSFDELLKIDGEGRCIVTDHEHFVLFNVYGPRAQSDDNERIQFKHKFFNIMQKRWESLLGQGRRIFVVGDLNIAPSAIDCCEAGPDFEKNEFRTWFRSLLVRNGGAFFDVFREKHPQRTEAYTCWPTNSGAEEFNFGTRIDHLLCAGPCLHKGMNQEHTLVDCHVKECDILEQFKRWKPGNTPRHKDINSRNGKLEGSDHAPIYMSLVEIPNIQQQHNTPSLSTRYCPQVYGCQQTLVSMFAKRLSAEEIKLSGGPCSVSDDRIVVERCSQLNKRPLNPCPGLSDLTQQGVLCTSNDCPEDSQRESSSGLPYSEIIRTEPFSSVVSKKKARQSQLSLKSFFQKTVRASSDSKRLSSDKELTQEDIPISCCESNETSTNSAEQDAVKDLQSEQSTSTQEATPQPSEKENNDTALVEWQRIQQLMQTSIPLCKGHKEPCVTRVVKKSGPNLGRRFYVCARAEGPSSNSEANCGFFKWATTKSKTKK